MFTQKKSLQHKIDQLEDRIKELEAELKQKDIDSLSNINNKRYVYLKHSFVKLSKFAYSHNR